MKATKTQQPALPLRGALQQLRSNEMQRSIVRVQLESDKLNALAAQMAEKARAGVAATLRSANAVKALRPALLTESGRGF